MNRHKCIHCNGKGYNGLDICTGCFELSADEFHRRFEKHEKRASESEYHAEFVEDIFDVVTDQLIESENINVGRIRATVINYLDEEFGEELE